MEYMPRSASSAPTVFRPRSTPPARPLVPFLPLPQQEVLQLSPRVALLSPRAPPMAPRGRPGSTSAAYAMQQQQQQQRQSPQQSPQLFLNPLSPRFGTPPQSARGGVSRSEVSIALHAPRQHPLVNGSGGGGSSSSRSMTGGAPNPGYPSGAGNSGSMPPGSAERSLSSRRPNPLLGSQKQQEARRGGLGTPTTGPRRSQDREDSRRSMGGVDDRSVLSSRAARWSPGRSFREENGSYNGVVAGTCLVVHRDTVVFESLYAKGLVCKLQIGDQVEAAGPPKEVDGRVLVPLRSPEGAVAWRSVQLMGDRGLAESRSMYRSRLSDSPESDSSNDEAVIPSATPTVSAPLNEKQELHSGRGPTFMERMRVADGRQTPSMPSTAWPQQGMRYASPKSPAIAAVQQTTTTSCLEEVSADGGGEPQYPRSSYGRASMLSEKASADDSQYPRNSYGRTSVLSEKVPADSGIETRHPRFTRTSLLSEKAGGDPLYPRSSCGQLSVLSENEKAVTTTGEQQLLQLQQQPQHLQLQQQAEPVQGSVCQRVVMLSDKAQKLLQQMSVYVEPTVEPTAEPTVPSKASRPPKAPSPTPNQDVSGVDAAQTGALDTSQRSAGLLASPKEQRASLVKENLLKDELESLKFRVSKIELELQARSRETDMDAARKEEIPANVNHEITALKEGASNLKRQIELHPSPSATLHREQERDMPETNAQHVAIPNFPPTQGCSVGSLPAHVPAVVNSSTLSTSSPNISKDQMQTARIPLGSSAPALCGPCTARRQYNGSATFSVVAGSQERQPSPYRVAVVGAPLGAMPPRPQAAPVVQVHVQGAQGTLLATPVGLNTPQKSIGRIIRPMLVGPHA